MNYVVENKDGTLKERINHTGNIWWDETHLCPASALTVDEAKKFGVMPLQPSPPPVAGRWQVVQEADPVKIDGVWTQQWVVSDLPMSLDDKRAEVLAAINAERDQREEAGFLYRGKLLDSNPRSVQRITAAALAAQAAIAQAESFQIDWTCADNSTISLDADGVIGMPVALAQHAAALHAYARQLKEAVEAAASDADLLAIDLGAGWPA